MPTLVDVLAPEAVALHVHVASKRQLLHDLADAASDLVGAEPRAVLNALHERERLGSTGVGQGVALPHARVGGVEKLAGLFWQLDEAVPFDAIDDVPVDLVFVLIVPEHGDVDHLKALARIARRLRDPDIRARLRTAGDRAEAWHLLTDTAAPARSGEGPHQGATGHAAGAA
ncbi:MAG: PTS sugar transporter subunit IIA [Pseudomonadota bacterium]